MPNSFEIIVDSNAVAKRCFVLFVVGASAFLGTLVLLTQACCGWLSLSNAAPGRWSLPGSRYLYAFSWSSLGKSAEGNWTST
jgi:hypothetical protein